MRKYILTSIIIILFLNSCVKDEQPAPIPPPPIDYSSIVINELITKDTTNPYYIDGLGEGADWIELFNNGTSAINISDMWITDLPGTEADYIQIPNNDEAITTIPPMGYLVLICGAKNADGSKIPTGIADGKIFIEMGLSSTNDNFVAIYNPEKVEIDKSDDFNGLEDDKSFGRETNAAETWVVLAEKSPGAANSGGEGSADGTLIINELITKDTTNPYYIDGLGEGADWIELFNNGTSAINISDMWITDLPGTEADYIQIPNTNEAVSTIPPKGYLVLICGAKNADGSKIPTGIVEGKLFIEMGLSSTNDNFVAIYNPEKVELDKSDDFNELEEDKSFGRETDASGTWVVQAEKSPGAANGGGGGEPVVGNLIINEFMCSNDTTFIPDNVGPDNYPDWIEIYNTGETAIDIGGWYVTESLADPMLYQIPTNIPDQTTIPGHGYLILKADGVGTGINVGFKLGSGGDDIGLSQDGVNFVDALSYGTGAGGGFLVDTPLTDLSAGRTTDGGATWQVFDPNTATGPTPGSANGN